MRSFWGDSVFDCVLCSEVLIYLEDMRPALREIIRVSLPSFFYESAPGTEHA
jgi:ubiquinone/menaquinone biosynthesis C-methylase UbiE